MRKITGQASLILILLSAVALIFFAITLNWGRIAQTKAQVTIAANTGASTLASYGASSGEQTMQTTLGGVWKKCDYTSVIVAIATVIIAVIVVICTLGAAWPILVLAILSLVLAVANLAIQVLVIQPGLTQLWNKLEADLTPTERFLETGISTSLQSIVNDPVQIPDYFDENMDGKFFRGQPDDQQISRFGFYYTERLKALTPPQINLEAFAAGLEGLVTDLNLSHPASAGVDPSPVYNPCCVPLSGKTTDCSTTPPKDISGQIRPNDDCSDGIALPSACLNGPYGSAYPFLYDPTAEDPDSANDSFRARLGHDDENKLFTMNPADPTGPQQASTDFNQNDATKLFQLLWEIPAGQVAASPSIDNVTTLPAAGLGDDGSDGQCKWTAGADRFCSTTWPYSNCGSSTNACNAAGAGGSSGPKDCLDNLVYGLPQFFQWANTVTKPGAAAILQKNFVKWYPDAAFWIAPKCGECKPTEGDNSDYCEQTHANGTTNDICTTSMRGPLLDWRKEMGNWATVLKTWLDQDVSSATAWCAPKNPPAGISASEKLAVYGPSGKDTITPEAVVACLDWNITNYLNGTPGHPATPLPRPNSAGLTRPSPAALQARYDFLNDVVTKAKDAQDLFQNGHDKLDAFLAPGGPADLLMQARKKYDEDENKLPSSIIYGWQDPGDYKGGEPVVNGVQLHGGGYWHIVKVEAASTAHCGTTGSNHLAGCQSVLPHVVTWTEGFLDSTRCYELRDDTGSTGIRVRRYDEEHAPVTAAYFANKVKLWQFRSGNGIAPKDDPRQLLSKCGGVGILSETTTALGIDPANMTYTKPGGSAAPGLNDLKDDDLSKIKGAFMISDPNDIAPNRLDCIALATTLLQTGVSTTSCAEYRGHQGGHMKLYFKACPKGWPPPDLN